MPLPEGTVTFLRSDIEGSMGLVRALGARYDELNAEHQVIVRAAVAECDGQVVRTEGDAFFVVFTDAARAARAAVAIEMDMAAHDWPEGYPFKLRIGIHAGAATRAGDDYGGFEVNRAARIAALGSGGQIILSDAARALIVSDLPEDWGIRELGAHRLKGVVKPERLFQLDAPGLESDFPGLRSEGGATQHLPTRMTTFVGRESELKALGRLLGVNRLLTLTGPGGTGKTTLALELARRHATHLKDGTWYVDLQAVRDPREVRAEIAHGLGLFDGVAGPAAARLMDYVAERQLLIVIDNFEQVVEAADVIGELLLVSSQSRIIVTSRVPLHLSSEQEYAVRPLQLGPKDGGDMSEAVRLFIDRARRVRPDLQVGADFVAVVGEICRHVDGLPLAIELCAARVGALPIGAIADRLARRLPLPGSGPRDLPERQRTVEDTVAWSHDLLEPALRRLFARLSVFAETFDYEQAEVVCGPADELGMDVLDGLVQLVEQSLVMRLDDEVGGIRFGTLATIRTFGLGRLGESGEEGATRARHARAYAALADTARPKLVGSEQARWILRLEADDANLRSATQYAIEVEDAELALRLNGGLWRYWVRTGRLNESRDMIGRALALPGAESASEARMWAVSAAGSVEYWGGDPEKTSGAYEEQLALARQIGSVEGEAEALLNLSFSRYFAGDRDGAQRANATARAMYEDLGDESTLASLLWWHWMTSDRSDTSKAIGALTDSLAVIEAFDDDWHMVMAMQSRCIVAMLEEDYLSGVRYACRAMRGYLLLRDYSQALLSLDSIAVGLAFAGLPEPSTIAQGAAAASSKRFGVRPPQGYSDFFLGKPDPLPSLEATLGTARYSELSEQGARMSIELAVAYVEDQLDVTEAPSSGISPLPAS